MRLLVTGATGQVGFELARGLMPLGEVVAVDRGRCDLAHLHAIPALIDTIRPDVIVNAAAYTAVDRAEQEEALATTINGTAVGLGAAFIFAPYRRVRRVFSAVTNRSSRATEGLARPACVQSFNETSSAPVRRTDVTRRLFGRMIGQKNHFFFWGAE